MTRLVANVRLGAFLAGGLFLAGVGCAAHASPPIAGATPPAHEAGASCSDCPRRGGERHDKMHGALAQALGMTTEQLDAELAAGKTVPQIAEAHGIDFANVREAVHAAHGFGPASEMGGPRGMERHGGPGMSHAVDCPMMSMGASKRAPGGSQN